MILPLTTAALSSAAFLAWAVRGKSASIFAPSVWRGPRDRHALALTFDDGPSESTPEILDILTRHNAVATFFQCGASVDRLPAVARAVADAGHEIGNHSYSHPYLFLRSPRAIADDLRRAQETVLAHTGIRPVWFRAPYGVRWPGLRAAQKQLHLTGVMWTVIGYDWNLAAERVVRRITGSVSNGSIICLHDGRELRRNPDIRNTIRAAGQLIPMLLDQGYRFETVSRLCQTT